MSIVRLGMAMALCLCMLASPAWAEKRGFMLSTLGRAPGDVAADVAELAGKGATIVRLPLYFGHEPSLDSWFKTIDAVVAVAAPQKITVVIDFHHPTPGKPWYQGIDNVDDFVNRWKLVATRYAPLAWQDAVWYELCNEPNDQGQPQGLKWKQIALKAAKAIRKIDKVHPIVFGPEGATIKDVEPLPGISNQVLTVHFWDWSANGKGGVQDWTAVNDAPKPNPNKWYDKKGHDKAKVYAKLSQVAALAKKHNLRVYIGEVGANTQSTGAAAFLKDVTDLCAELKISCTIHAFREASVWNYETNAKAWKHLMTWLKGK